MEKITSIEVTFKPYAEDAEPNTLVFRLAPTEGMPYAYKLNIRDLPTQPRQ